jgi:hypothetical protein
MNADQPRVRHRGYFLSDDSGPDLSDHESPEGLSNFRPNRPRRAKVVVAATRRRRHRAAVSSQHSHSHDRHAHAARKAHATGSRQP